MNEPLQSVLNFALNNAIHINNISMVKDCLSVGAIVTSESIQIFSMIHNNRLFAMCSDSYGNDYSNNIYFKNDHTKLFKVLLTSAFDEMVHNDDFIKLCIIDNNQFYIKSLIKAGYNGHSYQCNEIFKYVIKHRSLYLSTLQILLDNGFDKYVRSGLIICIKKGYDPRLELLFKYGATPYQALHEICSYVETQSMLENSQFEIIKSVTQRIDFIKEPTLKYLFVKLRACEFNTPIEIIVYILQLYVRLDRISINHINQKMIEVETILKERENIWAWD